MAFVLAIYGLIIFPEMYGYIEMVLVETFEQIQESSNLALAILAKIFRSLNYCPCNQKERTGQEREQLRLIPVGQGGTGTGQRCGS